MGQGKTISSTIWRKSFGKERELIKFWTSWFCYLFPRLTLLHAYAWGNVWGSSAAEGNVGVDKGSSKLQGTVVCSGTRPWDFAAEAPELCIFTVLWCSGCSSALLGSVRGRAEMLLFPCRMCPNPWAPAPLWLPFIGPVLSVIRGAKIYFIVLKHLW